MGDLLAVLLFGSKVFGDVELGHDRSAIDVVTLNFLRDELGVFQDFGTVGKYGSHFVFAFEPFLLCVVHSVEVINGLARAEADESVVSRALVLAREVAVVGRDDFDSKFGTEFEDVGNDKLLLLENSVVGIRYVCLVALDFEVVVITHEVFPPLDGIFGFLDFSSKDFLWHFACETSGGDDEPIV